MLCAGPPPAGSSLITENGCTSATVTEDGCTAAKSLQVTVSGHAAAKSGLERTYRMLAVPYLLGADVPVRPCKYLGNLERTGRCGAIAGGIFRCAGDCQG
jgi:hypothetical protein